MATKKVTPAAAKTTTKKVTAKSTATATKTAKTTKTKAKPGITEADIRKKAEELYNARMVSGEPGDHESDWLNAEKALASGKKK